MILRITAFFTCAVLLPLNSALADFHFANSVKIGEVHAINAIIWARTTEHAERNTERKLFTEIEGQKVKKKFKPQHQPVYNDLTKMQGRVAGAPGEIRLSY